MRMIKRIALLVCLVSLFSGWWMYASESYNAVLAPTSCTNILVGKKASITGRAMISYSCDGGPYGRIRVVPAQSYPAGSSVSIYDNTPFYSYTEYQQHMNNPRMVVTIPQVQETYQYVDLIGWYGGHWGGMNEYGVTLFETTIGGRSELVNSQGAFGVGSQTIPENSLIILALQRAKTAREAISIIGSLAEKFGYYQPEFHGENISITDGKEVWILEIFGPGIDWHPGDKSPGAVWCAQRIPDDHVCVSANRSRIGEIDLDNPERFMYSPNAITLAIKMGWWDPNAAGAFLWYEAYAPRDWSYCSLREWRVLDTLAPSLKLDPHNNRFPLSVPPDAPVSLRNIMALHRDFYAGTPYDARSSANQNLTDEQIQLIYPYYRYSWIGDPVQEMLGVHAERTLAVWSAFSCVAEVDAGAPQPIRGCLWYGQGPAATTCYVPIYSGVRDVPNAWKETDPTRIDWVSAHWAFSLVHELSRHSEWESASSAIARVRNPAENTLIDLQKSVRNTVRHTISKDGTEAGCTVVTQYTETWLNSIVKAYWELVDYLLFTYYFPGSYRDPQSVPQVGLSAELMHSTMPVKP